jgi:copper chaperone CopZ
MKRPPLALLFLGGAALILGWIAWSNPTKHSEPTWIAGEGGEAQVPTHLIGALEGGLVQRSLAVEGMCCKGCTRKLYDALLAVPGVDRAAVDFEAGQATAAVPADFRAEELVRALNFDKYEAHLLP